MWTHRVRILSTRFSARVYAFLVLIHVAQTRNLWSLPVPFYGDAGVQSGPEYLKSIWRQIIAQQYEYSGYDGWYNNYANPDWGATDTPLLRRLPAAYADGVYEPSGQGRPDPIAISEAVMSGNTGHGSERGRTVFLVFFGQQVVDEILDTRRPGCPPEYFNIPVPENHHLNKHRVKNFSMPFLRSRYDAKKSGYSPNSPRSQLNERTPWIDGGLIYGTSKTQSNGLRSFFGGELASTLGTDDERDGHKDFPAMNNSSMPMYNHPSPVDHYIKNVNRLWRLGNSRGNENPFLLTFGVLWYRFHNGVAKKIQRLLWEAYQDPAVKSEFYLGSELNREALNKKYDEKIFNEARKWTIAVHQKIVMYDWLPSWLKMSEAGDTFQMSAYTGYKPDIHPQILQVFQSAAMRFGHTLVPPGVYRRKRRVNASSEVCEFITNSEVTGDSGKKALRTCNVYWNSQEPISEKEYDIDEMILGMSSQITVREDAVVTPDLRGYAYGGLEFSRRDLMAVNIQRGRDHGLADYNKAREFFNLNPITDWLQINPRCSDESDLRNESFTDCDMIRGLRRVYNDSLDDIDIWVGGLCETTGDGPGPLFQAIISEQFTRIRDADRFWFENHRNQLFTDDQREAIRGIAVRDVVLGVTDIQESELAGDPFFFRTGNQKCEIARSRALHSNLNFTYVCPDTDTGTLCAEIREHLFQNNNISEAKLNELANCDNINLFQTDPCPSPSVINGDDNSTVLPCTEVRHYDYFTGSEWSYILTFLIVGLFAIGCVLVLFICAQRQQQNKITLMKQQRAGSHQASAVNNIHEVSEWQGKKEGLRSIKVKFDHSKKSILIYTRTTRNRPTRTMDCSRNVREMQIIQTHGKHENYLLIRVAQEYDLVVVFDDSGTQAAFGQALIDFCTDLHIQPQTSSLTVKELLKIVITKAMRQKQLDKFFRVVFKQAFRIDHAGMEHLSPDEVKAVLDCELTIYEFADAMSLKPSSIFVRNMFDLIDKDNSGLISFREFLDMIVVFAKGGADDKARLLFDMYDVSGDGELCKDEFRNMLRSLMDLANSSVDTERIDAVVTSMFEQANFSEKSSLTFDDFRQLLTDYKDDLDCAQLDFDVDQAISFKKSTLTRKKNRTILKPKGMQSRAADKRISKVSSDVTSNASNSDLSNEISSEITNEVSNETSAETSNRISSCSSSGTSNEISHRVKVKPSRAKKKTAVHIKLKPSGDLDPEQNAIRRTITYFNNYMENYYLHIFWVTLYTLLAIAIFAERAYYFSIEREHGALRRITGYGVTVTRGAASGQMFTYSTLLLTMCRNLITALRETFMNRYIPFDSVIWFHKYVAYLALLFTGLHVIGHSFNFYHISTQTPGDVSCLFSNFHRPSHVLPTFHYWCWSTLTGFTGVILTLLIITIYVYAQQYSRRNSFRAFWLTHQLFYLVFILMILHGAGNLVQAPLLHTFLIGPLVIFIFDKLYSISRNRTEIAITKAKLLPSDVTCIVFKRPAVFEYRSGQWVRIACLDLGEYEYHPFTLTSAPNQDYLSLHIRAVGPWTSNLRSLCDPNNLNGRAYPKLYLDGPFGEGHQDWYKYGVSVLVGGGIGVTPFASVLKDIVHKSSINAKFNCKKVYFLWVTRSQKQFEWVVDIIREVEEADTQDIVSVHIFITAFYQKFDLRTTLLYICERHFQKISGKSLLTGLQSITHFGRPDFMTFLQSLTDEHPDVAKIGVFSCGPAPMTRGVEEACSSLNKYRGHRDDVFFCHHYENF